MTLINGVENPCAYCGRSIRGKGREIDCVMMRCHVENCHCILKVGEKCYRNIVKNKCKGGT